MFGRFLPRQMGFFDFFERHAALVVEGARLLRALAEDGADVREVIRAIKEVEHQADDLTRECITALHKTFITPIDRNDIHRLSSALDDVIDIIDGVARRLRVYEITSLTESFRQGADVVVQAAEVLQDAVAGLRDMKQSEAILASCQRINDLEHRGDGIHSATIAELFREERDPITLMKWHDIYERLENATDACQHVANIVEGVVLENA